MDLGQHSQELSQPIWTTAGGSATSRSVGRPLSSPQPMANRTGRGHVTSLSKVHIFHIHWGNQQAVNLGVHLYQIPNDSGSHFPS